MVAGARDWSEGYVVDVEYARSFYPGLAPLNLAVAAIDCGVRPPDVDGDFAYLDLGCGQGFTPALLAAANPHARFWGNDFIPAHVRSARGVAHAAALGNAHFIEASFADMLDADLPPFDFVVAHGIWSWVSAENRDRIVALLARRLKPGGLLMLSYNCHPGWDALMPLRRLLLTAAQGEGTPAERIGRALGVVRRLREAGADHLCETPAVVRALDALDRADPAYLAHEYLNAHWTLFHAGEVAEALRPAGLRYVGQARPIDNVDECWLTPAQRGLIEADPAQAEHLRDLILDRRFRRDLFVRDGETFEADAQDAWFADRRFVLGRARDECSAVPGTRVAAFEAWPASFEAVLDALASGPATGAALAAAAGLSAGEVRRALTMLVAAGHVLPALAATGEQARRDVVGRFNAAAMEAVRSGDPFAALGSPITGSGVAVSPGEQLLVDALGWGVPLESIAMSDVDGSDATERFRTETLPQLAMLGIL